MEETVIQDCIHIFRNLLGYSGDKQINFPSKLAEDVIIKGRANPDLRDEIYCQLFKQINKNPNPESAVRYWHLLCLCVREFPPCIPKAAEDPFLTPYLLNTLRVWRSETVEALRSGNQTLDATPYIDYVVNGLEIWGGEHVGVITGPLADAASSRENGAVTPRMTSSTVSRTDRDRNLSTMSGAIGNSIAITAIAEMMLTVTDPPQLSTVYFSDSTNLSLGIMASETVADVLQRLHRLAKIPAEFQKAFGLLLTPIVGQPPRRQLKDIESVYAICVADRKNSSGRRGALPSRSFALSETGSREGYILFQNLFYPKVNWRALSQSPANHSVVHLAYARAVRDIEESNLHCSEDLALRLAGIQFQV
jgi:hypothetical protein